MKKHMLKTRHALLLSVISLMTCFAMLVGATFAWFTDSVTSGVNRIVAGNLDVELYHKTTGTTTADPGDSVSGATKLFNAPVSGDMILWEPGAMAYETFTVKNVGSLSLDYKLQLSEYGHNTVMENAADTTRSLLDVLRVAVVPSTTTTDRATLSALTEWTTLKDFVAGTLALPTGIDGTLDDKDSGDAASESFTLVLYWPSDTEAISALTSGLKDNDYNLQNGKYASDATALTVGELWVNLGVTLVATQHGHDTGDNIAESDSFGPNYDVNATYPQSLAVTINSTVTTAVADTTITQVGTTTTYTAPVTVAAADTTIVDSAATSTIPAAATLTLGNLINGATNVETDTQYTPTDPLVGTDTLTGLDREIKTTGSTSGSVTYDIGYKATVTTTTTGDNPTTTTAEYAVHQFSDWVTNVLYIGEGLDNVNVTHSGDAMTEQNDAITDFTGLNDANGYFYYDSANGDLYIYSKNYSEYAVTWDIPEYVAVIGNTGYLTLEAAIEAVKNGETILLLKDVTQTNGVVFNKPDYAVTLDLGGHTFHATNASYELTMGRNIHIKAGTLTIQNGELDARNENPVTTGYADTGTVGTIRTTGTETISAKAILKNLKLYNNHHWGLSVKSDPYSTIEMDNCELHSWIGGGIEAAGGDATVTNSMFVQEGKSDTYGWVGTALAVSYNATLTVSNFDMPTSATTALYVYSSGGTINVESGAFSGTDNLAVVASQDSTYSSTINISGGTFGGEFSKSALANDRINITGGTFDHDPTAYVDTDEYLVEANDATNPTSWTVKGMGDIAKAFAEDAGATDIVVGSNYAIGTLADNVRYTWYADGDVYVYDTSGYTGTTYTVPNYVTGLGGSSFKYNTTITTLKITGNITYAYKALQENSTITTVDFGSEMTSIPNRMFYNCSGITSLTLPATITRIEDWAFYGNTALQSLTAPGQIEYIGYKAFDACSALQTLDIQGSPAIMGWACRGVGSIQTIIIRGENATVDLNYAPSGQAKGSYVFCRVQSENPGSNNGVTLYVANDAVAAQFSKEIDTFGTTCVIGNFPN